MRATNTLTLATDKALYVGEIPATGWHCHAAAVLLMGLSGRFALHWGAGRVETCRSALVAAGVEHVFDPCGETVALVYLEPDSHEARRLSLLFEQQGGVLLDVAVPVAARSTMEGYLGNFDLPALLPCLARGEVPPLDARVAHSLLTLRHPQQVRVSRSGLAAGVQLSPSRFNHLFRAEMGVSLRSYRVWSQVRLAMAGLAVSPRLTDAALHGEFTDSAHFSRMFRQTFGMTPSSVLKPLRRVTLLG
ncbi:AraC family transcriptional regulator [Acidovorax sp. sic0104]|uniref:helix-turn-helix domain-containing protein n=1 Tax=Acidovorax sp. sic0104 TaxID=2854784 RepID=UPI001C468CF5|nr:AraC family transcriptional regulator [Acidovorax sp. sic0104]